jgi:tRNA synthetases class I (M)
LLKRHSRRGTSIDLLGASVSGPNDLVSVALLILAVLAMSCRAFSSSALACSKRSPLLVNAFHTPFSSLRTRSGGGRAVYRTTTARWLGASSVLPTTAHKAKTAVGSSSRNSPHPYRSTLLPLRGTPATSFDDGQRPYQITTPIYYVNDKPHIGHAYTSVAADVLARYMRLAGRKVFFQSGTDEHGEKVQLSAASRGVDTQQFVDSVSQNFRDMSQLLNLELDCFVRTTDEQHKRAVQVRWNDGSFVIWCFLVVMRVAQTSPLTISHLFSISGTCWWKTTAST